MLCDICEQNDAMVMMADGIFVCWPCFTGKFCKEKLQELLDAVKKSDVSVWESEIEAAPVKKSAREIIFGATEVPVRPFTKHTCVMLFPVHCYGMDEETYDGIWPLDQEPQDMRTYKELRNIVQMQHSEADFTWRTYDEGDKE